MARSDSPPSLYDRLRRTHSIPLFEGCRSRRHQSVPLWKLLAQSRLHNLVARRRLRSLETFVQFAGFPRSGHSLIGSILDAHPQARIAHELDAMGLFEKGFSPSSVFSLIDKHAHEFTRHGRYWNGFSYLVPDGGHGEAARLRVIGDKKGDGAVRAVTRTPDLLDRLQNKDVPNWKWILILRNPFDNIATMSLRQGREYDKLRIEAGDPDDFRKRLKEQQGERIVDEVQDAMIDDYAALCTTVERMKQVTPAGNWLEVAHENVAVDPRAELRGILAFLGLSPDDDYLTSCAGLVNGDVNRSRYHIRWMPEQRERVRALIRDHSFLRRYEDDNDT